MLPRNAAPHTRLHRCRRVGAVAVLANLLDDELEGRLARERFAVGQEVGGARAQEDRFAADQERIFPDVGGRGGGGSSSPIACNFDRMRAMATRTGKATRDTSTTSHAPVDRSWRSTCTAREMRRGRCGAGDAAGVSSGGVRLPGSCAFPGRAPSRVVRLPGPCAFPGRAPSLFDSQLWRRTECVSNARAAR